MIDPEHIDLIVFLDANVLAKPVNGGTIPWAINTARYLAH